MGASQNPATKTTADVLYPGATVRYHWASDAGLATITERTETYIEFKGERCDGRFTHDQINRLFADGRLEVILDDTRHDP